MSRGGRAWSLWGRCQGDRRSQEGEWVQGKSQGQETEPSERQEPGGVAGGCGAGGG